MENFQSRTENPNSYEEKSYLRQLSGIAAVNLAATHDLRLNLSIYQLGLQTAGFLVQHHGYLRRAHDLRLNLSV